MRRANGGGLRRDGRYVLYWMTAARRLTHNHALDRALEWCSELDRPLVILEGLRCDHPWAGARHHKFVIDGMAEHARALAASPVTYYPYLEPEAGHGSGLLEALASAACVVVGDDHPGFFFPYMTAAAAPRIDVRMEVVDSVGLLPLAAAPKTFHRAVDFRRFLQRELPVHLQRPPSDHPLAKLPPMPRVRIPETVVQRWPAAELVDADVAELVAALPVDANVPPVDGVEAGTTAGLARFEQFLDDSLGEYDGRKRDPATRGTSGISAHLHYGHLSTHQLLAAIARRFDWSIEEAGGGRSGARLGWWGLPEEVEAYLDELVTWRELNHVFCHREPDYHRYASLPEWARRTLEDHLIDPRPHRYSLERLDAAETHDPLWNAAQRQLARDGVIHSYLRMLWGKRVLEWTRHPDEAREYLIHLNNRYALDGRDPNSYGGIMWVFGRFDRAWGPERPIFGKVRYMSSDNTRRKLKLDVYLERYA